MFVVGAPERETGTSGVTVVVLFKTFMVEIKLFLCEFLFSFLISLLFFKESSLLPAAEASKPSLESALARHVNDIFSNFQA